MILVTGGCGFIGAALVKALVLRGEKVRVFDDFSRGRIDRLDGIKVDILAGDVRDKHSLAQAAKGCDEIMHLACVNGTKNFYDKPGEVLDIGVTGMQNVLYAINLHHVKKLVFFSSSEVYQDADIVPTGEHVTMKIPSPWNPRYSYAAVKIISEMLALHNCKAQRVLILRPHNIYGPDMGLDHVIARMCQVVSAGRQVMFSQDSPMYGTFYGADETRAFCYIDDAISQILLAREKVWPDKAIVNIGSEDEITIRNLARHLGRVGGFNPMFTYDNGVLGSPLRRCPDISQVKQMGYRPQYSLDDGLKLTLEWYLQESKNVEVSSLRDSAATSTG